MGIPHAVACLVAGFILHSMRVHERKRIMIKQKVGASQRIQVMSMMPACVPLGWSSWQPATNIRTPHLHRLQWLPSHANYLCNGTSLGAAILITSLCAPQRCIPSLRGGLGGHGAIELQTRPASVSFDCKVFGMIPPPILSTLLPTSSHSHRATSSPTVPPSAQTAVVHSWCIGTRRAGIGRKDMQQRHLAACRLRL